ncbi:hypothetical protein BGW38_002471 [Lunasporangiospora selenospora]|uniref:FAD-binding FR-type domain-containing protein n=1 Tax=Lunasporangiospora selenospora TaxID=979761 RepID=A0A9P6G1N4_9FUNG|nr:hypothetical protein BGW38_002471 [Lunasporangiospora selenospora]
MATIVFQLQEPSPPLHDRWHSGERAVQDLLHVRQAVEQGSRFFRPSLTTQMQDFVPGLRYMFLGTLDEKGRPWVSMLAGPLGFMHSPNSKTLEIKTTLDSRRHSQGLPDPILHNLLAGEVSTSGKRNWGGVALDFSNRRRNKMNGVIYEKDLVQVDPRSGEFHVRLTVEQTIGNCPKYITIRELEDTPLPGVGTIEDVKSEDIQTHSGEFSGLTAPEKAVIQQADSFFIASRFIDDTLLDQTSGMDCNHRGGNPGFVRINDGKTLVLPDYSGNRFFNTLGNVFNDPRIGLLFIDFNTGDTLHLTGRAQIFVGMDAQAVYPHAQRAVQVVLDGSILRKSSIPFKLRTSQLSPYNPIVPLYQDRIQGDQLHESQRMGPNLATLTNIQRHTDDIATFQFKLARPIRFTPGQYAVLDFSQYNQIGYQHMAPDDPQSLNDDYIRTWTISSAPNWGLSTIVAKDSHQPHSKQQGSEWTETSVFTMTIKKKHGGVISTLLHQLKVDQGVEGFSVPLVSTGGSFVLPDPIVLNDEKQDQATATLPSKLLFISGGIGSTPFISMLRGIQEMRTKSSLSSSWASYDIQWILSAPDFSNALLSDLPTLLEDQSHSSEQPSKLKVHAFLTREKEDSFEALVKRQQGQRSITLHSGRFSESHLKELVSDIQERHVFVCGPDSFMDATKVYLEKLGVVSSRIITEEFTF